MKRSSLFRMRGEADDKESFRPPKRQTMEMSMDKELKEMRTTQVFFHNVMSILESRDLSLAWLEEKTGVSEVLISTFEWVASGLSFLLVIKTAIALGVSVSSLITEGAEPENVAYGNQDAISLYRHFWMSVDYTADREDIDLYEIAWAAGKTIAGIVSCATNDKDIDIQRADAIALLLDSSIDELLWQMIPAYPETDSLSGLVAVNL